NNRATGIIFYNVTNGIISNNSISDNDYGICLINSHMNKIMNNSVSHNQYGIQICLSTHNTLYDNSINENDIIGIDLITSSQNFITNNTISNNPYGIYCTQSGPEIYGTMISGSDYAVYLGQSASYIKDCRFEGNVNGLYNIGGATDCVMNVFSSVCGTETASFIDGGVEESFGITLSKRALIKSVNLTVEGEGYGNEALTEDSASQMCPALYENWLVWQDKRDGNWDIYAYDLSMDSDCDGIPNYLERPMLENDPSLQCITNNSAIQMKPDIWGDTIVWTDLRHGNYDVYAYSFSNKTEWAVTRHPSAQWRTSVFGDHIVWSDLRNDNYDVYMLNISKNEVSRLSFSERHDLSPRIFKDRVVWYSYSGSPGGSEYSDIHLFDICSWKFVEITNDNAIQYCPDIDDNNVVWHDNRHSNWEIYKLDLNTMQEERITSDPEQKFCPRINQNRISYYFHDRIKDIWSVRMYNLESGVQRVIEAETDGDSHPVIYGSRIAWVNKSDAKNDIYVLDDNITGSPRDVHLDVGCDGDPEFYHEKEFEGMAYADERALLSGLKNFMSDEAAGNVKIPIRLSFNGTGSVSLGPLEIVY
ncbi:MAG: right-handed parallel beta-helix repeat-containing protein, partial [Thermoplasmata archaeon]|nr:right-handed parallel beta-helix repeat-containing protein [Thermoplasmata archaeon]